MNTKDAIKFFKEQECKNTTDPERLLLQECLKDLNNPSLPQVKPKEDPYDLGGEYRRELGDYVDIIQDEIKTPLIQFNRKYIDEGELCNDLINKDIRTLYCKSTQGSGKSYFISKYVYLLREQHYKHQEEMDDDEILQDLKFLSITSRRTLGLQHLKYFNNPEPNIKKLIKNGDVMELEYYLNMSPEQMRYADNLCIQLDSLIKLNIKDYSNHIVFIDEINSLVDYLLSSSTLQGKRVVIYNKLVNIIKQCKYLFVVDADISTLSYNFINNLRTDNDIFLWNHSKPNDKQLCLNYLNLDDIYEKMNINVEFNQYFTCCCDSQTEASLIHAMLIKNNPDKADKIILYTAKSNTDLPPDNSGIFLIYSPKLVYGFDYSIQSQDVFCISTRRGNTLNAPMIVQQLTRNRKIKNLHIYIDGDVKERQFNSINEVQKYYTDYCELYVSELNEFGGFSIGQSHLDNPFIKMYYEYVYKNDLFKSNIRRHTFNMIKGRGFKIYMVGEAVKKPNLKELKEQVKEMQEDELIKIMKEELTNYSSIEVFNSIKKRCEIVKVDMKQLYNDEGLTKLGKLITDDFQLKKHFSLSILMKKIDRKELKKIYKGTFLNGILNSLYTKESIMTKLEGILKVDRFNIKNDYYFDSEVKITEELKKLITKSFKFKVKKNNNWRDVYMILLKCYKNVIPDGLYKAIRLTHNRKQIRLNELNKDEFDYHFNLMLKRDVLNNQLSKVHKHIMDYQVNQLNPVVLNYVKTQGNLFSN